MPSEGQMQLHLKYARPEGGRANDPIFYIGPFGTRVSFASQQRRALNVVGSLIGLKLLRPTQKIAVIGAGLAGLCATVALALRRFDVDLFESADGVLALQAGAQHRYVHPTVNFWPIENSVQTTDLPFLDWYATTAYRVIETLRKQWFGPSDGHPSGRDPQESFALLDYLDNPPRFGKSVALKELASNGQVILSVNDGEAEPAYDIVLVAMGFGVEQNFDDSKQKTYWQLDSLDDLAQGAGNDILISGTGDGGVIDCLRLLYKDFRKGAFPLDVIERLESDRFPFRVKLEAIERGAPPGDPVKRASYFADAYSNLIDSIPRNLALWLQGQLIIGPFFKFPNRIRLLGVFGEPQESTAAVVNRFLLAFALKCKALEFVHGTIDRIGGEYIVTKYDGSQETINEKTTRVVIRHGPRNALKGFIDDSDEASDFKRHQLEASSYTSDANFENEWFLEEGHYPSKAKSPMAYGWTRFPIAAAYFQDHFDRLLDLDSDQGGNPIFVIGDSFNSPGRGAPSNVFPTTLFGIPVMRPRSDGRRRGSGGPKKRQA